MKIILILISSILISCKSTVPQETSDFMTKLIAVHKSGQLDSLISTFGLPTKIEKTDDVEVVKYIYEKSLNKYDAFETFINHSKKEIISSATFFWKSDDDYELLKRRFGKYQWTEKYIPTSSHPLRELYEIKIPELGMSFEYDRLAPKIMWIFFSKPQK